MKNSKPIDAKDSDELSFMFQDWHMTRPPENKTQNVNMQPKTAQRTGSLRRSLSGALKRYSASNKRMVKEDISESVGLLRRQSILEPTVPSHTYLAAMAIRPASLATPSPDPPSLETLLKQSIDFIC